MAPAYRTRRTDLATACLLPSGPCVRPATTSPDIADYDRYKGLGATSISTSGTATSRAGIGGIFYDYHWSGDPDRDLAYTKRVGLAFLEAYPAILRAKHDDALDERGPPRAADPARAATSSTNLL